MCQCGCVEGNEAYKLRAPDGWYVIEFQPGCDYCDHGPGLVVFHPDAIDHFDNGYIDDIPELPWLGNGELKQAMLKCGPSKTETANAAIQSLGGTAVDGGVIDGCLAEILGEDFWQDHLTHAPSLIKNKGKKIDG